MKEEWRGKGEGGRRLMMEGGRSGDGETMEVGVGGAGMGVWGEGGI